jgi:hypothetical protein
LEFIFGSPRLARLRSCILYAAKKNQKLNIFCGGRRFTMFFHVRSETAAFSERDPSSHPLDPETLCFMEQHLGRNLDDVRIRSGKAAAASAGRLGAEAYARGRTIVLGHGCQPDTPQGRWLLAHELAHVIQQSNGRGTPAHADAATLEQPMRLPMSSHPEDHCRRVSISGRRPMA